MALLQLVRLRFIIKPAPPKSHGLIIKRRIETKTICSDEVKKRKDPLPTSKNRFHIECGKYASLADGCAVVQLGGTAVMATVVAKGQPTDLNIPLSVTYAQKAAAIGKIPTNFFRRDLGQSDYEILLSRVLDRSVRPLFEPGLAIETQIYCNPLALDGMNFPDVVAINAASAALACSDIPWLGPVAAVRLGLIDKEILVNPTKAELANSLLNLIVSCIRNDMIVMIEGSFKNVSHKEIINCMKAGIKHCRQTLLDIENKTKNFKKEKRILEPFTVPCEIREIIKIKTEDKLMEILKNHQLNKLSRDTAIKSVFSDCVLQVQEAFPSTENDVISAGFFLNLKELYRHLVLKSNKRCDGRNIDAIRDISGAVGLYDALHGSAMFKRGQTQVLCTVALDSPNSVLKMDKISQLISGVREKNFFFDYRFPPFATGELGVYHKLNRRERGHAALAEKALQAAVPDSLPFTVRLTSEVLESNGSSSMASVCGGSMALFDAGIQLEYPVAGVAMGLLTYKKKSSSEFLLLTDLMGMEDYLGDMDFKIAGTKTGFTAIQVDMKIPGLPLSVINQTLLRAKKALKEILQAMEKIISQPHEKQKNQWPVLQEIQIPLEKRFKVYGYGLANLKKLELEFGVEITSLEDGKLCIFASNQSVMDEILNKLKEIQSYVETEELEFGGIYKVTVTEVLDHGCFVKLNPGARPVFIPLTQLDTRKVRHPSALNIGIGSEFQVKYFGRDPSTGAIRFSRRVLLLQPDT